MKKTPKAWRLSDTIIQLETSLAGVMEKLRLIAGQTES